MNVFSRMYCRAVQKIIFLFQSSLVFREPELYSNLEDIETILIKNHKINPLIVVSNTVSKSKRFISLIKGLNKMKINYVIDTSVSHEPTFNMVYNLKQKYIDNMCDAFVAIGGGSVIDASKGSALLVSHLDKKIEDFRKLLSVKNEMPLFIACPTTAGTGSECTAATVITNEENNDKFALSDPKLIPHYAILDDSLLDSLPQNIISVTGVDALSHAIEAYLGMDETEFTNEKALEAIKLIKENLLDFYNDHSNDNARGNMLRASYLAGLAFTRAYVGYVHSLAHAIGGTYHKVHGYCIGVLLPYVLEAYNSKIYKKLSKISDYLELVSLDKSDKEKANAVISWIKELNNKLGISSSFDGLIKDEDLNKIARHASKEANPFYPVPKLLNTRELKNILIKSNKNS